MNKLLPIITLAAILTTSCFENTPPQQVLSAASCPAAAVSVFKVSFNESQGKYLIFHSAPTDDKTIPNPLTVENLQMAQVPTQQGTNSESAKLNFSKSDGKCTPILEMTQGYKIELASGNTSSNPGSNGNVNTSSSSGSYWAPFLMGALVGNAVSGAMQPRYAPPAYYLPPPSAGGQGGLVTGGVSGKTPDEMSKKYESQYKQSPKKGFFSKSGGTSVEQNTQKKKSGFFSGGSSDKSGGFFKKKKR